MTFAQSIKKSVPQVEFIANPIFSQTCGTVSLGGAKVLKVQRTF
ncbi:MAG: hypothetical protein U9O54_02640 [Chloroflexota bacterium]|nr:hypothetical protein [Chloroflexota bacterium]